MKPTIILISLLCAAHLCASVSCFGAVASYLGFGAQEAQEESLLQRERGTENAAVHQTSSSNGDLRSVSAGNVVDSSKISPMDGESFQGSPSRKRGPPEAGPPPTPNEKVNQMLPVSPTVELNPPRAVVDSVEEDIENTLRGSSAKGKAQHRNAHEKVYMEDLKASLEKDGATLSPQDGTWSFPKDHAWKKNWDSPGRVRNWKVSTLVQMFIHTLSFVLAVILLSHVVSSPAPRRAHIHKPLHFYETRVTV